MRPVISLFEDICTEHKSTLNTLLYSLRLKKWLCFSWTFIFIQNRLFYRSNLGFVWCWLWNRKMSHSESYKKTSQFWLHVRTDTLTGSDPAQPMAPLDVITVSSQSFYSSAPSKRYATIVRRHIVFKISSAFCFPDWYLSELIMHSCTFGLMVDCTQVRTVLCTN